MATISQFTDHITVLIPTDHSNLVWLREGNCCPPYVVMLGTKFIIKLGFNFLLWINSMLMNSIILHTPFSQQPSSGRLFPKPPGLPSLALPSRLWVQPHDPWSPIHTPDPWDRPGPFQCRLAHNRHRGPHSWDAWGSKSDTSDWSHQEHLCKFGPAALALDECILTTIIVQGFISFGFTLTAHNWHH